MTCRSVPAWTASLLVGAVLAATAAAAQEGATPWRLAQAGPLVLPGAAPSGPTPSPSVAPEPADAPPPASVRAPTAKAPNARPPAVSRPAASARARQAPVLAKPQPVPAAPVPEALPGFENLPPPPPPPPPAPAAADAGKSRGKAARKTPPPPVEATTAPLDAGPPLADDAPPAPVLLRPALLPAAVTGTLQPMALSDLGLLTRRRLLLADAPPLAGGQPEPRRSVRTASAASVAPLYAPMAFVLGTERVYDPQMASPNALEMLPLALNSLEALREGIPVGPFRAGLIEDNPGGSPRIETGTVIWQVEGDPAVTAERGPTAIKAIATLGRGPARVVLTLRNEPATEGSGPLSMELQADIPGDAIVQAGIPEMRNSGIDRGVALYAAVAGDPTRIRFAFASNASDGEQNVRMLAQRSWIDVPVRLRSGRKVVFAMEKGTAVRDMMREAFRLWRLPWLP